MVCSVLALHRVSPRCFNLSGLRPASVRDQLLRSTLIVRSLREEGLILPYDNERGLLIYGAGAAGINAAMEAAWFGVHVTVVEKSDISPLPSEPVGTRRLFSTFSQCLTRKINATEYDWPHDGWRQGRFLGPSLPQASPMAALAQAAIWRGAWRSFAVARNGRDGVGMVRLIDKLDASNFRVVHGPDAELIVNGPWPADEAARPDEAPAHLQSRKYGALVSCVGIGSEAVTLEGTAFSGPCFWSDADGMYAGMPLPDGVTRVVISGGGDRGMQDLQRVATSYYGGTLYERLESLLEPGEQPDHELRADLLAADETARRSYCWAGTNEAKLAVATRWHQSIKERVFAFFDRRWSEATFRRLARDLLREQLLDDRLRITWVIKEPAPGAAYVLNRFLVLLLIELSKRGTPRQCIVEKPSSRIWNIVPAEGSHTCSTAQLCVGKWHTVTIGPVSGNRADAVPSDANLIMIRHGLQSAPLVLNGSAPVTDQMLPLGLA